MAERAKLLELAERCEAAEGPDRKLDEAIERATGNYTAFAHYTLGDDDCDEYVPTRYSASIDAAMTLAKANWLVGFKGLWDGKAKAANAFIDLYTVKDDGLFWGDHIQACATTPALALTAACLRARATENTDAPFA